MWIQYVLCCALSVHMSTGMYVYKYACVCVCVYVVKTSYNVKKLENGNRLRRYRKQNCTHNRQDLENESSQNICKLYTITKCTMIRKASQQRVYAHKSVSFYYYYYLEFECSSIVFWIHKYMFFALAFFYYGVFFPTSVRNTVALTFVYFCHNFH